MKRKVQITLTILGSIIIIALIIANRLGFFPPFSNTFGSLESIQLDTSSYKTEKFAVGLEIPWAVVFTSPQRVLVTERPGRVREIINGKLKQKPLLTLDPEIIGGEGGLMGMVLHPDYAGNKYIYLCHTYESKVGRQLKIVRYQDKVDGLKFPKIIIDELPSAQFHTGCELGFGPDNLLYATLGDAGDKNLAQNLSSLAGKTIRLNADGTVPPGNPFFDRPGARTEIYSYGHRNAQGLTWDIENEIMYQVEHGPSGFDGPGGYDEVNLVAAGKNYGWPLVIGDDTKLTLTPPITFYTPAIAPGSAHFYTGEMFPELQGQLLVAALRGQTLIALKIENGMLVSEGILVSDKFGRLRDVTEGSDGSIYFTTSNRDGRGNYSPDDDVIYRISK